MLYRIRICTNSCPYCGNVISKERNGPNTWGMKFGRCPYCNGIYRTKMKLYSDLSQEKRDKDRKEFLQAFFAFTILFAVFLILTIVTGFVLLGVLSFFSFIGTMVTVTPYFLKRKALLRNYTYLRQSDPELYQLEYFESIRLVGNVSIENVEESIIYSIENKILKYVLCLFLSAISAELFLWLFFRDTIKGLNAVLLLVCASICISVLLYFVIPNKKSIDLTPTNYTNIGNWQNPNIEYENKHNTLTDDHNKKENNNSDYGGFPLEYQRKRFCSNCGKELLEGALFCDKCGEKVNK